jgi:hypothetical protein
MDRKPIVLLEAWQLISSDGLPLQLTGYATGHPRLRGFRRHIATSRLLRVDHAQREAETLHTIYRLRRRLSSLQFDRSGLVRLSLCHLGAEREPYADQWIIRNDRLVLATSLSGVAATVLTMLSMLDREGFDDSDS